MTVLAKKPDADDALCQSIALTLTLIPGRCTNEFMKYKIQERLL